MDDQEAALDALDGRIGGLRKAEEARVRTIKQMEEYLSHNPHAQVNCKQVINLLSLTWPDGNYSSEASSI